MKESVHFIIAFGIFAVIVFGLMIADNSSFVRFGPRDGGNNLLVNAEDNSCKQIADLQFIARNVDCKLKESESKRESLQTFNDCRTTASNNHVKCLKDSAGGWGGLTDGEITECQNKRNSDDEACNRAKTESDKKAEEKRKECLEESCKLRDISYRECGLSPIACD